MSYISDTSAASSAGAAIGSAIPGVGTLLGAGIGAVGSTVYNGLKSLFSPNSEKTTSPDSVLSDYYVNLGKVGNKKQTRALDSQSRLAALNQYYTEQNNAQDMANTYALTRDTASLESAGKRDAGLSLAGDGNTSIASTPQMSAPGIPSAAAVDDSPSEMDSANFVKDVSSLLSNIVLNKSAARKNNADAAQTEIDNMTENEKRLAELDSLHASNKISNVEYKRRKNALMVEQETATDKIKQEHEATKQSEVRTNITKLQETNQTIQNDIASILKQYHGEELKKIQFEVSHQLERFSAELDNIKADTASKFASAASSRATALYTSTLEKLESAKVPNAERIANALASQAENGAKLAYWNARNSENDYDSKRKGYNSLIATNARGIFNTAVTFWNDYILGKNNK